MKKLLSVLLVLMLSFLIWPQISLPAFAQSVPVLPTRTTALDLSGDDALASLALEDGVILDDGVYTNAAEGWSYDTNTAIKTLTLSGAYIDVMSAYGVLLPADSKIVLADGTKNMINGGDTDAGYSSGVYAAGTLTIEGAGTLIATGGNAPEFSYGIYLDTVEGAGGSKLTIAGGEITALGGTAGSSYGIFALGAIAISECTVNATGGTSTDVGSTGIASEAGGITITGTATTVNAMGGMAKLSPENEGQGGYANSMGIYALGGDVLIDGHVVVNASGGTSENESVCGIHLNKSFEDGSGGMLTICGDARVTAAGGIIVNMQNTFGGAAFIIGGNAVVGISVLDITEGESSGINITNGYLMISEKADVTIDTGGGKYGSFGIFVGIDSESVGDAAHENDGKLIVTGGNLEVRSGTARNSRAIVAKSDIEISGGTIAAQSGTATEETSTGIFSNGRISVSGNADLTAQSGKGPSLSAAVYANGGITLDPSFAVMTPAGGGVSADGLYISVAADVDDDYATDVHVAPVPAKSATAQPIADEPVNTVPVSNENTSSASWIVWLIALAAVMFCAGGAVFIAKKIRGKQK